MYCSPSTDRKTESVMVRWAGCGEGECVLLLLLLLLLLLTASVVLVVRVLGYRSGGPGSIAGTTKKKVLGL
jgi:hypothetical protein